MSGSPVRFAHRLEYAAVLALSALAGALPPRAALALGRGLGTGAWRLGIRRRVAAANLARAFPEKSAGERATILREAYGHAGMTVVELLRAGRMGEGERAALVGAMRGVELVTEALRHGTGVVIVSAHFGASELMAVQAVDAGIPIHFFVRAQSNALVDGLLTARRRALGAGIVGHGERGVREALTQLRRGICLAVMADQDAGRDGVFVPFFGQATSTPPGPAEFALRTGAPLFFAVLHRTPGGGYAGVVEAIPAPTRSGDHAADVRELTRRHAAALERVIREYPAQWMWTHRRWKTLPSAVLRLGVVALGSLVALAPGGALAVPADSAAALAVRPAESTFDGAGSTVFPLERARVRRLFEDVRIRRGDAGWSIVADEWFEAGVAPATAVFALPDYRASLAGAGDTSIVRGTLRDLEVTVDGLPMAIEALPGNAAPGADLGGIERILRFRVPFAAGEKRGIRLVYRVGESHTDAREALLFYYRNPGSLWEGESPKSTVRVDLGAWSADDLVIGWLRPKGYRLYADCVLWHRPAGEELADIALGARPLGDPLGAFTDRKLGPLSLSLEAREEWFERLTANELRYFMAWLLARRGGTPPGTGPGSVLAGEAWWKPVRDFREEKLSTDERRLMARLRERLDRWERSRIPFFAGPPFLPGGTAAP